MQYKFHDYKFKKIANKYYDIIRSAMNNIGHEECYDTADINFYNHTVNSLKTSGMIIVKPTAPTSQHFALDTIGYANSSSLAYSKPDISDDIEQMDWASVLELRNTKPNKWDDSVLLKWRDAKDIKDDHILIIGQMPDDETVNGFGFGDHIKRMDMIINKLKNKNLVIKLHPRYKNKSLVKKWKEAGHHVITGFDCIHSILPKTRVAIIDNSTAGIECLLHEVPIISYGWPEYHWATQKLQTLPQLEDLVNDLSWHRPVYARQFIEWYINHYLCHDVKTTQERLKEILNAN
jgi:hypothetical protein